MTQPRKYPSGLRTLKQVGFLIVAFAVVACAAQDTVIPVGYDQARAKRLFSVGYKDITNIYIDRVDISDLAVAGIGSLASIDPGIAVKSDNGFVTVSVNGTDAGHFAQPRTMDAEGWGQITAAAISASRSHSAELDESEAEAVYAAVFDGVLDELDAFSRYAGREAAQENRASRDGFGGIGVRIRLVEEGILILSVMENTPAESAGLQQDDVITHIAGVPVDGLSQREAVGRLRGKVRSQVNLTIDRPGREGGFDVAVVRSHIIPQTVMYQRDGNIAVITLSGFNQNTTRSLRKKVDQAKDEMGNSLAGMILDLRNNPGGLLEQSVSVSDLFVRGGRIVSTQGRHPDSHQYFEADGGDFVPDVPMVVLVNGNSASAAEIVAAALQDSGRAVVVGSSSFGKGSVQTLLRLPNQGELTLTWARFYAPSGYAISRRGVMPDICTTLEGDDTDLVLERIRTGEYPIDRALRSLNVAYNDDSGIEKLRAYCPARETQDEIDLEVAKHVLTDPGLYARALHGAPNTAALGTSLAAE